MRCVTAECELDACGNVTLRAFAYRRAGVDHCGVRSIDEVPVHEVLANLLDFRTRWIKGTAICTSAESTTSYHVEAWPLEGRWTTENATSGVTTSYSAATQLMKRAGAEVSRPSYPLLPTHESVSLAFPLSLPVWGRTRDDFMPVSAERFEDEAVVLLRHRTDPHIFGSLVVNLARGHAIRLLTPMSSLQLSDLVGHQV